MIDARNEVLWFGAPPTPATKREFEQRGHTIRMGDACRPLDRIQQVSSVVAFFDDRSEAELCRLLRSIARRFVDFGVRLEIVAPDDATLGRVQTQLQSVIALPGTGVRTSPDAATLAEGAARHDAGEIPRSDLKITVAGNREPIRKLDEVLFQRAFARCSEITLVELTGGRSGARVFAVHMTVDRSDAGIWPQPAFAKLDGKHKIDREYANYREYAARFIPFGLRPNVDCVITGSERSLLVGDFVDRSESLWDLARRNVASNAITALVDETLGGWRDQAYANDPIEGSVAQAMCRAHLWRPESVKPCYVDRAEEFGARIEPDELLRRLKTLTQTYREAPIHGDLHGENVRVRNGSAILIDLASVVRGPIVADLAALETWLAFEVPPELDSSQFEDCMWSAEIDRLYGPPAFRHPPGPPRPATDFAWMAGVVRQIRTLGIATQSCPTEYQSAVAVQLLHRCEWDDGPSADRFRRGYGYRVATALVADLVGEKHD
ncbi:phosphotransferase [Tardiphaga sp. OK245]|uniref:phosphotransferase n=1 Tax=Tardiphaga sp. OK245 TaxID=1855306 RepID=UPI0008A7A3BB|nr:phosphotransferase [Tardiphaga sp. OK245]SEH87310.1 Phosphotransferase enzyme family protein [Tardiphaga sp. OK245]